MSTQRRSLSVPSLATVGKCVGLLLFLAVLFAPNPDPLPPGVAADEAPRAYLAPRAQRLAAAVVLMAVLWLTQALPIAVTALLPLVLFPLLGVQSASDVSNAYVDRVVFLFVGGFVIALGIEKWGLHRRIALHVISRLGGRPALVVLGFMLATAGLSMWISNTASTLLMLPIGLAMLVSLRDALPDEPHPDREHALRRLQIAVLLGIGYSASIGGFTTLVGTPTNVAFVGIWTARFRGTGAPELAAGPWTFAILPMGLLLLFVAWRVLVFRLPAIPGEEHLRRGFFRERLRRLGPATWPQRAMLAVFAATALLWMTRKPLAFGTVTLLPGWGDALAGFLTERLGWNVEPRMLHDSTVAVGMAVLLFLVPAERDDTGRVRYLMDWETALKLPWGILLLVGGGFAIAGAFESTGLSQWLGGLLARELAGQPLWLVVAAVCLMMTFLTEFTTNVATVSAVAPVLIVSAAEMGVDPRLIVIPAVVSTSCAFMLPIATPPNAIVFGSGKLPMNEMIRYGILLNLLGVAIVTITAFTLLIPQFGIDTGTLPQWAAPR